MIILPLDPHLMDAAVEFEVLGYLQTWNRLPTEAVNSASVEQFKIELDKVIDTLI